MPVRVDRKPVRDIRQEDFSLLYWHTDFDEIGCVQPRKVGDALNAKLLNWRTSQATTPAAAIPAAPILAGAIAW